MASLFTLFSQRQRPLSHELQRLLRDSGLWQELQEAKSVAEVDAFAQRLPDALKALRPTSPSLGGIRPAAITPASRYVPGTYRKQDVQRHHIAVKLEGDPYLVSMWPDDIAGADELEPVDAAAEGEFFSLEKPDHDDEERLQEAREMWTLSKFDAAADQWAIYTAVALSLEEEREVNEGKRDIQRIFDRRVAEVEKIIAKIAEQTDFYFDTVFPGVFEKAVAQRRDELTQRAGVTASLKFPRPWRLPPPALAPAKPVDSGSSPSSTTPEAAAPLSIMGRHRFHPASFEDVQRIIRIWADEIERYPGTFSHLGEDQVSDLLTATLNANLPGAKREVYSRTGKSDIFIQADVLAAGTGPAKVFICESKIARSEKVVTKALDPQLFRYLNVHDTAAVLLLLMPQRDFNAAVGKYSSALKTVRGFTGASAGPAGWPIFDYEVDERVVHVCIATVHIAP
ncbi:hypothetical protein [Nocardia testacea]|uniref:hypothetical protein n=1 Tax=Nocardia testacea TaxID=248551 RepID=UPI00340DDE2A